MKALENNSYAAKFDYYSYYVQSLDWVSVMRVTIISWIFLNHLHHCYCCFHGCSSLLSIIRLLILLFPLHYFQVPPCYNNPPFDRHYSLSIACYVTHSLPCWILYSILSNNSTILLLLLWLISTNFPLIPIEFLLGGGLFQIIFFLLQITLSYLYLPSVFALSLQSIGYST